MADFENITTCAKKKKKEKKNIDAVLTKKNSVRRKTVGSGQNSGESL